MSASQDPLLFDGEDAVIDDCWRAWKQDFERVAESTARRSGCASSTRLGRQQIPRVARWRPFTDPRCHPGHRTRLGKHAAGRNCGATAMYQKLVDQHSFNGTYN